MSRTAIIPPVINDPESLAKSLFPKKVDKSDMLKQTRQPDKRSQTAQSTRAIVSK